MYSCPYGPHKAAAPTLMVARLSVARKKNEELSIATNLSGLQAELDIIPDQGTVATTSEIAEIAREETETLTRSGDNLV